MRRGAMAGGLGLIAGGLLTGCASDGGAADLEAIYGQAAREIGPARTPVIVIPGILGTKLEDPDDGTKVWGAFTFGAADADTKAGARLISLPMQEGAPLSALRDDVVPTEVLDNIVVDVGLLQGIEIGAYVDILMTLAAGEYRDEDLGESGAIDYGGAHYTCFQFGYDWRRDISEQAAQLHEEIVRAQVLARTELGLEPDAPVKVDVVAHSMGGMVLRYYLRYGPRPLPDLMSNLPLVPTPTWEGAANVRHAVLVGTPNAGSILSLRQLVDGWDLNPLFPNYRPFVLGTMPAIYGLLPRTRHARVVDEDGEAVDLYDIATWERYGWGLADPDQERYLDWILPDVTDPADRRRIAREHLAKCLARAAQLHRALDVPATPPAGTTISLFAGDSEDTASIYEVDEDGELDLIEKVPGDGTVTRDSALMDERVGRDWTPGLDSPVDWGRVQFLFDDHIGITASAEFSDNLLFLLLETPID